MIDSVTFATEWALLEDRFQTRHNPETAARYLEDLSQELDTEQFRMACGRAFRFETFFPSPQCLIDHALGDFLNRAEDAWDDLMGRLAGGSDVITAPGTLERQILARLGGSRALAEASDYGRRDMREQFIRRYARALRSRTMPGLPATRALPVTPPAPSPLSPVLPALPSPRGKTIDFLKMARMIGVPVSGDGVVAVEGTLDDTLSSSS
ncbi:hypothetical protein [Deinococcus budaensis]|uniref:Uncharacterized protein n=1 Tax=Deinococcus budaensis TaxID=1665626 RepID=A0A7W8LR48_9DEIO|nr:hypothetical protein [Deinococcus budaensis]MBB5235533.1 hypothetical protein [Deinococcus budaensis]